MASHRSVGASYRGPLTAMPPHVPSTSHGNVGPSYRAPLASHMTDTTHGRVGPLTSLAPHRVGPPGGIRRVATVGPHRPPAWEAGGWPTEVHGGLLLLQLDAVLPLQPLVQRQPLGGVGVA